jgi:uncharacterized protein YbgA (DUF1722 family)/uncharacterized protein YbbK (DUF523 family)
MRKFARPIVVVSQCLGFAAVRYDGAIIHDDFVKKLEPHVKYITVCPEMEIGLGTPRDPVRIVRLAGDLRLIQPATGKDFTDKMNHFSEKFLGSLGEVDGFIMKSRSPSSGIKDVKIYQALEKAPAIGKGAGFFGGRILEMFPGAAIEDEGRLLNLKIREHFLTRIFTFASFREVQKSGAMARLVTFHAENKYLLMSANQKEMRIMGRIVANHEKRKFRELVEDYRIHLQNALLRPPRESANINTMMHVLGYFSDKLSAKEKSYFLNMLEKYRARKVTLPAVTSIIRAWIVRFDEKYLADQTFFEPYPEELVEIIDSGRGREV